MKRALFWFASASLLVFPQCAPAAEVKVSEATQACIECHTVIHPGIVQDWQKSRHSQVTPRQALAVKGLGLKVSSTDVPEELRGVAVGSSEHDAIFVVVRPSSGEPRVLRLRYGEPTPRSADASPDRAN